MRNAKRRKVKPVRKTRGGRRPSAKKPSKKPSRFTKMEEERLVKKLLRERETALKQLALWQEEYSSNLRESSGDLSSAPSHIADMGTDQMERENTFFLATALRNKIRLIDEALENLYKKRNFGMCRNCGKPIQKTRLKALPYALLCLDCKQRQEK